MCTFINKKDYVKKIPCNGGLFIINLKYYCLSYRV